MDTSEYIDDYFNGQLDEAQRRQFEQRIISDASFAEEVAFYVSSSSLLKEQLEEEKKTRFRELYRQAGEDQKTPPVRSISPAGNWKSYVAAAALLMIVAGLWWIFIRKAGPEQLANEYILRELQTQGVRMSIRPDSLQSALNTYNSGDLHRALEQFEAILRTDTSGYKARQYAGFCCLRLGEYDKALQYFIQMEGHTGSYSNPAVFYQALTLMKRGQPGDLQQARQLLQRVADQDLDKKEIALQWLNKWPQ